ncbi:MAG: Protein of unknown function (DUF3204) [Roseibaca calidilacus]|uniref:Uncharacterized protein n=1 Tax=Roseibaca calidilacus TaxID=1666912 RepID=A0A0N8K6T5_9RHOB|nr:DUF6477 family protein [Roseibaca calidilacus]KPP89833.1 MAG: Protein of unknown function (DUF3204) [Roseibaca calidilacus]CUX80836.1 hypothetical protein Ga0058931_1370 [Roseibaca calidilacus]
MDQSAHGLQTTIRPRLLVVAARHGLAQYDRSRSLGRLLGLPVGHSLPEPAQAQAALTRREAEMDRARRAHDASWHPAEHVLVMTALLHEARSRSEAVAQTAL